MAKNNLDKTFTGLEIAVIGMSCDFPDASDIVTFWNNLKNAKESVSFLSNDEVAKVANDFPQMVANPNYVPSKGGVIEGRDFFDNTFFNYSTSEARVLNPQTRKLLECAWHAIEDSGYSNIKEKQPIGVYCSCSSSFYWLAQTILTDIRENIGDFLSSTLADSSFASSIVSYKLNFTGPSMVLHTACSSSLVSIHQACRALLTGECKMAMAGGVSLSTLPKHGYVYLDGMINSPDGHCRTFDENAKGTIRGEGVGVVILKPYKKAIADGDRIYAVIKGSAINNDGNRKVGYAASSVSGQIEVIKKAHKVADVDTRTVGYIEAHGTGTNLGDIVELEALREVYGNETRDIPCKIGSIKTNLGHLDAAAGVAGFIKACLALYHKIIPASLNCSMPTSKFDFTQSPFEVAVETTNWNTDTIKHAAVSSFGIGGTNAHLILEAFSTKNTKRQSKNSRPVQLIKLSAKSNESLASYSEKLALFIDKYQDISIDDIAYTLDIKRRDFSYKRYIVASDSKEFREKLLERNSQKYIKEKGQVVFMFSGQGSQYINMGLSLYNNEPYFRSIIDECFDNCSKEIKKILYPASESSTVSLIDDTEYTQVVIFVFQYALAKLLMHWGVEPKALIGHSLGEFTAACIAGTLSLTDAIELLIFRGELVKKMPNGRMISVRVENQNLADYLTEDIEVAAINDEYSYTLSGNETAIVNLEKELKADGIPYVIVNNLNGFHSYLMDEGVSELNVKSTDIKIELPSIPYVSNVTGEWISASDLDDKYWGKHLRNKVRFREGVDTILSTIDYPVFVEIGPGAILSSIVRQQISNKSKRAHVINVMPANKDESKGYKQALSAVGELWKLNVPIDWGVILESYFGEKIQLPNYAFDKKDFSLNINASKTDAIYSLLQRGNNEIKYYAPKWEQSFLTITNNSTSYNRDYSYLILSYENFSKEIAKSFEVDGNLVVQIIPSLNYQKVNDNIFYIDINNSQHYDKLLKEIKLKRKIRILHALGITSYEEEIGDVQGKLEHYFYSILNLVRALNRSNIKFDQEVIAIANNIVDFFGESKIMPLKSTVVAAAKIMSIEYPSTYMKLIDVGEASKQKLMPNTLNLLKEEFSNFDGKNLIAYRGNTRWIKTLAAVEVNQKLLLFGNRKDLNYVVTGGFGGMGLTIIEHLTQEHHANILAIVREGFPPRNEWKNVILTDCISEEYKYRIKKILELESQYKVSITIASLDISNKMSVDTTITNFEKKFGDITGVFHTAGVPDHFGIIQKRTNESIKEVMLSKIDGTIAICNHFKNKKLGFFVLFSSGSNYLYKSKFGQIGYIAGNEFLEAYADYCKNNFPFKTIVVNWNDWKETGMSLKSIKDKYQPSEVGSKIDEYLKDGLTRQEGLKVLMKAVNSSYTNITLSKEDILTKVENYDKEVIAEKKSHNSLSNNENIKKTLKIKASDSLDILLLSVFKEYVDNPNFDVTDDFFESGGDSLKAIYLLKNIEQRLNVNISIHTLYKYPIISQLVTFIKEQNINKKLIKETNEILKPYTVFSDEKDQAILMFPPSAAHAFVYQKFASLIKNFSIYGFNFLTDENRIEKYVEIIKSIKQERPLVLFGYSSGGALAFEVCKALEAEGVKVSDLILFDTYSYRVYNKSIQDINIFEEFIESAKGIIEAANLMDYEQEITSTIKVYHQYSSELISRGKINANIHLLIANDRVAEEKRIKKLLGEKEKKFNKWEELTNNQYIEYKGYGSHNQLLSNQYIFKNYGIVNQILDKIK